LSKDVLLVHFFSSVAYVWVRGAKTAGPIAKKFGFSYVSENFKFQCDPFSNQKDVSQRSIYQLWCLPEILFLDYFSTKFGTFVWA
jgi:hypothetical protein